MIKPDDLVCSRNGKWVVSLKGKELDVMTMEFVSFGSEFTDPTIAKNFAKAYLEKTILSGHYKAV
jgi:hypothetical protein